MPSSASPDTQSPAAPHEFWQAIAAPRTFETAGPHSTFFPAVLDDGRQICLPIRPLADVEHALASLIVNQASFEVLEVLAADLARKLSTFEPDVVIGLPTLGLTLAAAVARHLGHSRYVPLGTSRKFWIVFLCLAALYESWSIPFSVIMAVPVGVLGALTAAHFFGQSNDVYFKVGLLTTIGLAAKNAILIVEFAKERQEHGLTLLEATLEAAKLRLRPIIMTSLAFILGVVPLAIATGAGSAAQNAIGIGVLGGMLSATLLGIFFVPSFFVIIRRLSRR